MNDALLQDVGKLVFDKDDQLAVEFVTAAANLRAHSFGIPSQSLFEAKGMAGNIIHAIATTNAIIAGLIVLEALKLLSNRAKECRSVKFFQYFVFRSFTFMGLSSYLDTTVYHFVRFLKLTGN